ncbi:MAG: hypothetical protein J6L20_00605 [Bacteroidales bacterium]|nr:hypothetical protein [Bacteroidales bacterium]
MIKNIFKTVGCLFLAAAAFNPVLAQENQTPASVAKLKMQNIWMNNTNNTAAGVVDASEHYSISSVGYTRDKGDFNFIQAGNNNSQLKLQSEGGGIYEKVNNMFMWGKISYTRDVLKGAKFNCLTYDPFRDVPFLLADTNSSKWIRQQYDLAMKMASPKLFNFLTLGLSGSYMTGTSSKQVDPRPEMKVSKFDIGASLLMSFGNHHIGFDYNYYNRREDGDATIMNTLFQSRAWDFVAPGFFKEAEFSANPIFYIERYYHAHAMGGGVQYGFKNSHWNILLSGNYQQRVEDINNEQLHEDPENLRKIIGTVKEDIYTGKLVANYTFNNGNMLSLNASYQDKSVDGIEYYQKFDSSIEVNGWVINAKYTTSNTSKVDKEVKLDYIVNDGNVYKWWFGVNYANRTNDWCYYLPQANQDVTNNIYGAFASRHIPFKKNHSLTISFNGGFSSNSEAFMKYEGEGTQPENAGWTDFTLRDFNYLTTNYTKFGGELSYAYSGFRKNESMSLFLTVALDHYTPGTDLFTNRTITNFTLGIAF